MVKIMNTKKYIFCRNLTNEFIVTIQTNTECLEIIHDKLRKEYQINVQIEFYLNEFYKFYRICWILKNIFAKFEPSISCVNQDVSQRQEDTCNREDL